MSIRAARATSVSTAVVGLLAAAAPAAWAAPDPCAGLDGPAKQYCLDGDNGGGSGGGGGASDPSSALDPLKALSTEFAKAAAWVVDRLSSAVDATGNVDFTNTSFLKTYAIVFGASTFLTLLLWLWAVVKRVIRHVPFTTAFSEAIGLLWLAVAASAFTPLVLHTVVAATDGITQGLSGGSNDTAFFDSFSAALKKNAESGGGGPIAQIVLSLVSIVAAGIVWLELTIRPALLYVGAVLGIVVYSGLVDKDLWGRTRRWVAIMGATILVKPIIVIVLRLAGALSSGETKGDITNAVVTGLAIIIIAIVASAMLYRMIPGMGDDIVAARRDSYDPASQQAKAAITRPVQSVQQGISAHAGRDSAARGPQPTQQQTSSAVGGISAHATRPSSGGPSGGGSGGGGGVRAPGPRQTPDPRQGGDHGNKT